MDEFENVETEQQDQESVQTDAAQAPEDAGIIALSDALNTAAEEAGEETEPAQETQADAQEHPKQTEKLPGGIKGRLLESEKRGEKRGFEAGRKAAEAAYAKERAAMQERLDRLSELELRETAAKIAQEEGCSEALAMRLARYERGLPPQQAQDTPQKASQDKPRDASGRFVSTSAADVQAQAQKLFDQAQMVKKATGVDVLALFNDDEDIRRSVAAGEKDFADVAREHLASAPRPVPSPVRNTAGGGTAARRFQDMSDEEFDRLQAQLRSGKVIDLRK